MQQRSDWEFVGTVYVDSGSIMVGDPCYTQGADASKDWNDFLQRTWPGDFGPTRIGPTCNDLVVRALGQPGTGIVVSSGYGDGEYPVYVKREDNRIAEVKVSFMDAYEEEDDE